MYLNKLFKHDIPCLSSLWPPSFILTRCQILDVYGHLSFLSHHQSSHHWLEGTDLQPHAVAPMHVFQRVNILIKSLKWTFFMFTCAKKKKKQPKNTTHNSKPLPSLSSYNLPAPDTLPLSSHLVWAIIFFILKGGSNFRIHTRSDRSYKDGSSSDQLCRLFVEVF